MQIYVVQTGDSIDRIAAGYGVSAASIAENNQIPYPYRLAVGQALLILEQQDQSGVGIAGEYLLDVGGYAYPFINRWVLEQTLPYMSRLMIFSYGFTAEGELVPPELDDSWMIETAKGYQVLPILTLTPLGADGRFNNNLVSAIVRDQQAQQRLIWQLGQVMQEKGYGGVDIDFEYIMAEDRDGFTEFVRRTTTILNIYGYEVSVALSPKTSADQRGLLYEGLDYGGLGAAANHVLLMTYEWGYTYEHTRSWQQTD